MIKVILWDIDGTLLNFLLAEKNALKKCFEVFGLGECTDEMVEHYSTINIKYWQMLERGEMTKPEILVGRFREFLQFEGLDASIAERLKSEYESRLPDTICFYPGALEAVKRYKGKYVQCVVTNGVKAVQDRKLAESGLEELMDYIFISEEVGYEKPSREFFDKVFETIGEYKPEEVLIVGDSLTSDMKGGENAGIRTCWFNPRHEKNDSKLKLDFEIDDLQNMDKILG